MDGRNELSPEENEQLRDLLRRQNAEHAVVKIVKQLPFMARFVGSITTFAVYLVLANQVLEVVLLPKKVEETYTYYKPKVELVAHQIDEWVGQWNFDPSDYPPTDSPREYFALANTSATTTTTPSPQSITIVSTSGAPADLRNGSGLVPPPSSWT
jgi:hypothetical protein